MEQKIEKKLFVLQIIAFELGVANSHNLEHYTWHCQWMCEQKSPKISRNTRGDFFQIKFSENDQKTW